MSKLFKRFQNFIQSEKTKPAEEKTPSTAAHSVTIPQDITKEGLLVLIKQQPNLRTLNLEEFSSIVDDDVVKAIGSLSHLVNLTLAGSQITDAGIANLKELELLKSLTLSGCTSITNQGLEPLEKIKLKSLALEGCPQIKEQGLAFIGKNPDLRDITLRFCNQLTLEDLKPLMFIKGLENLSISNCQGIKHPESEEKLSFKRNNILYREGNLVKLRTILVGKVDESTTELEEETKNQNLATLKSHNRENKSPDQENETQLATKFELKDDQNGNKYDRRRYLPYSQDFGKLPDLFLDNDTLEPNTKTSAPSGEPVQEGGKKLL